jgi:hypothetical protein
MMTHRAAGSVARLKGISLLRGLPEQRSRSLTAFALVDRAPATSGASQHRSHDLPLKGRPRDRTDPRPWQVVGVAVKAITKFDMAAPGGIEASLARMTRDCHIDRRTIH